MKPSKKLLHYAKENFGGVLHTTLNPEGPGVVRIHMIPPKFDENDIDASVAIINGQDIIPINTSWSVLLAEFIKNVNVYEGREITQEDADLIIASTLKNVKKVYPLVPKRILREDIFTIMNTFTEVAYGREVTTPIEYVSMEDYAPNMKAPHRMDVMVSAMTVDGNWHCNQKCIHCYAAGQKHSDEKELSTEDVKKVIDKLREIGIPQVTFTGGEPTMRDDIVELIEYASWFVTRLNTNGIKLTQEMCAKLKEASLDSVQITFYSQDVEVHNKLVGANQFENTVSGIENAVKAGLSVSVNTPLCTLNKDYVKTLEFLHSKGVLYVTCSGLITTGNALGDESVSLQLSKDEIRKVLKDAVDYCFANGMEISFTSPGWIEESFFEEVGINTPSCGACLSNMAVTPSGNVVPCQSWLNEDSLGNILTDDWDTIWNSEACKTRREYSSQMLGICPLRKENDALC